MVLSLSQLKSAKHAKRKRVGRGDGSGSGTYSGRGMKGQRSRSGGKKNLKRRGLKQMLMQIPKSRGFKSQYQSLFVVNLVDLEKHFESGSVVTVKRLRNLNLIPKGGSGVKVLGTGKISKKLEVTAHRFSKSAENAITKAGGTVNTIKTPKEQRRERGAKAKKESKKV